MKGRKEPMETYILYRDPAYPRKAAFVKQLEVHHGGAFLKLTDSLQSLHHSDSAPPGGDEIVQRISGGCPFTAACAAAVEKQSRESSH